MLLYDFSGMLVTLRAKKVKCGFKWWDEYGMLKCASVRRDQVGYRTTAAERVEGRGCYPASA